MYQLEIKPRAIIISSEAYEWYEAQKPGLGERFLEVLSSVFEKIRVHPERYGKVKRSYRQVRLHRFPYVVVYEIMGDSIVVFTVFHTSRNPSSKFRS